MQLEQISIQRNPSYHDFPDLFTGRVKFKQPGGGSIEIPLDHELSEKVLKLCAESIVDASKMFAQTLTVATLTQPVLKTLK